MARAGQMVKRSVTRCEGCCKGSSPGTKFGAFDGYSPIGRRRVRGVRNQVIWYWIFLPLSVATALDLAMMSGNF